MKTIKLTAVAALLATGLVAGGDIAPVTPSVPVTPTYFTGPYVGVGISADQTYLEGESNWFNDTDESETGYGYNLIAGYTIFNNGQYEFAVEGRYGEGIWSNNGIDTENYFLAIKPEYNVTPEFGVYALAGYGATNVDTAYYSIDEDGFVYGFGVNYDINKDFQVFADYVVNPDFDFYGYDIENDKITIGVNYRF